MERGKGKEKMDIYTKDGDGVSTNHRLPHRIFFISKNASPPTPPSVRPKLWFRPSLANRFALGSPRRRRRRRRCRPAVVAAPSVFYFLQTLESTNPHRLALF
jgi:hypothetical protein